ncbi:unnamed protein product [Musa acuminata subsp. malaccensis]|uniref:(wild Malaysian banana) hypothetical protein n=1 Tax=Musa acuminata subsp. malaccensis TaxID=214687 RepID=A0A804KPR0_MUSAM|nr:unnamed protein product [Musa acuminata subsp. malaccensis]
MTDDEVISVDVDVVVGENRRCPSQPFYLSVRRSCASQVSSTSSPLPSISSPNTLSELITAFSPSIKDVLMALYSFNRITLIKLGVLCINGEGRAKGGGRGVEAFRGVDNVILVDLMVEGSESTRKNVTVAPLNLIKSNGDKTARDIREVDGTEATMRVLVDGNNEMSIRGKNKAKTLLMVLKSERAREPAIGS